MKALHSNGGAMAGDGGFAGTRGAWGRSVVPVCAALVTLFVLVLAGLPGTAFAAYRYPRLSLKTSHVDRWITRRDSLDFLLRFQEIQGNTDVEAFANVQRAARARGHGAWADSTQFLTWIEVDQVGWNYSPQIPTWLYDRAKNNYFYLAFVAAWHNLHDYGVDWRLHDADGDVICLWRDSSWVALNFSKWCPKGRWDGRVRDPRTGRSYDFGSTVGKTFTEWLCTIAVDELFLQNPFVAQTIDGVQYGWDRSLVCWAGRKPDGRLSADPDPRNDGRGIPCSRFADATRASRDSLLTQFIGRIQQAGYIVRADGHQLGWAFNPNDRTGPDSLFLRVNMGAQLENYGRWGGWPQHKTGPIWFRLYQGEETYFHPTGIDAREGWDVSVIESHKPYRNPLRDQWTRLNLAQTLMGDGLFAGQAATEDTEFTAYLWGDDTYSPNLIPEMLYDLGSALGSYKTYAVFPRPTGSGENLYYRQFLRRDGTAITVVVNVFERELAGVPARDAQWFYGLRNTFPQPANRLVFDHGSRMAIEDADGEGGITQVTSRPLARELLFGLERPSSVGIEIYDPSGRCIRHFDDRTFAAGENAFTWDGCDDGGRPVGGGVYFGRVAIAGDRSTHKLMVVR